MTPRYLAALFVATPLAMSAACIDADSPTLSTESATLTQFNDTGPITSGFYETLHGTLGYEARRSVGSAVIKHHLDANNFNAEGNWRLDLKIGEVYVDGPGVNNRPDFHDLFGPDGLRLLDKSGPNPWIDLSVCDVATIPATCARADRIELTLENAGGKAIRYIYRATMPGETEPTVGGSFVALPDTQIYF